MNWENFDLSLEQNSQPDTPKTNQNNDTISQQNEEKRLAQLQKFKDFRNDPNRKDYIIAMWKFGELIVKDEINAIAKTLMTDECEIFLFSFCEQDPLKYVFKSKEFSGLYKGKQILRRDVKETSISLGSKTGFAICHYKILDENRGRTISQYSFEIFSFQEDKIYKYRASFGCMATQNELSDPFQPSKKEIMFMKLRELNYAWADQPDLEKIASLLHQNGEYKIWRWKDKKCFSFNKHNLVSDYRKSLEEDFVIKSIIPFEVSTEGQYIVGSYVYYLEGKGELAGQKFNWLSTCIFVFDGDLNLIKMNQQGELYGEDELLIPFEVHGKEHMRQAIEQVYEIRKCKNLSIFNTEEVNFSFEVVLCGPSHVPFTGSVKGFGESDKFAEVLLDHDRKIEHTKIIDTYFDLDDINYEAAIVIDSCRGIIIKEGLPYYGKTINFYNCLKASFENGKIAKLVAFFMEIPEPIPSPYDDVSFTDINIKSKNKFL